MNQEQERVKGLGWRQHKLLRLARTSANGYVRPVNESERESCRRLESRGLLKAVPGLPGTWMLP
jgi:hypothetical protein